MAQKIQRKPQIDQTMKKIFKSNFQPKYGYFGKTMCTVVAIQGDFRPKKFFWPKKKFFFRPKKKKNFFFGSDCRTPESDSRTPESVCRTPESDRRTPESVCRTQGVRLSDSGGKSVIYTLQARQTAPCEQTKKKNKKKPLFVCTTPTTTSILSPHPRGGRFGMRL